MNVFKSEGYSLVETPRQPDVAVVLLWQLDQEVRFKNTGPDEKKYYIRYVNGKITEREYWQERVDALDFLEGRKLFCNQRPVQAHWYDAGLDLHLEQDYVLTAKEPMEISYNERILVPHGYAGFLMARSSTNRRGNLRAGVVDPTFTGKLRSTFIADTDMILKKGTAFAQLVLIRCGTPFLSPLISPLPNYGRGG